LSAKKIHTALVAPEGKVPARGFFDDLSAKGWAIKQEIAHATKRKINFPIFLHYLSGNNPLQGGKTTQGS
jgi:hypothetical protein